MTEKERLPSKAIAMRIVWTFTAVAVLAGAIWMISRTIVQRDTIDRRKRVSAEVFALRNLVQNNNDNAALLELVNGLRDRYWWKRSVSATCLGQLGPKAASAVPEMARLLMDENPYVKRAAAESLARLGPVAAAATPALIQTVTQDQNDDVAWYSARALGEIGPDAHTAIPALIKALDVHNLDAEAGFSPGPQLAFEAADALAKFGPKASDAIPALRGKLEVPSPQFQMRLARAMVHIDPKNEEAWHKLIALLQSGDSAIQRDCLLVFYELRAVARPAIPSLQEYIKKGGQHRVLALEVLQAIEGESENDRSHH